MSVNVPEPNEDNSQGHPAWGEVLGVIPPEFHPLITPALQKWDDGVKQRLQELTGRYDPYKDIVEQDLDPDFVRGSLEFAQALQSDPGSVIAQAIEAFGLDYVPKDQIVNNGQQQQNQEPDPFEELGFDITQHPQWIAQQQALQQMQERFNQMDEKEQASVQAQQMEEYLGTLGVNEDPSAKLFVTALLTQGFSGEQAVEAYNNTINQAAAKLMQQQQPNNQAPANNSTSPVVMGSEGAAGAGVETPTFDPGKAKNSDVNAVVIQMLNNAARAATNQD